MKNDACDNKGESATTTSLPWLSTLEQLAAVTQVSAESRMRTMICCQSYKGKRSFFVPPDMTQLQPRSLRYLHAFARHHELQLVEDRRRISVQPLRENRHRSESVFAPAIGELFKQMGMPGDARTQSYPHRLAADSPHIPVHQLIRMAAFASPKAKKVEVPVNPKLCKALQAEQDLTISAYACKVRSAGTQTILSIFDSSAFRAIAYSAGKQYVVHLCLAGGSIQDPAIWANEHTLSRTDFQFQLFQGHKASADLGLFHATYYLDLADAPAPWWVNKWPVTASGLHGDDELPVMLQHTGT